MANATKASAHYGIQSSVETENQNGHNTKLIKIYHDFKCCFLKYIMKIVLLILLGKVSQKNAKKSGDLPKNHRQTQPAQRTQFNLAFYMIRDS